MGEETTSTTQRVIDLDTLPLRVLQKESTRALLTMDGSNDGIAKFNKLAHHNSQLWYKSVIQSYIDQYGGLPSECGPAQNIQLFSEKIGL